MCVGQAYLNFYEPQLSRLVHRRVVRPKESFQVPLRRSLPDVFRPVFAGSRALQPLKQPESPRKRARSNIKPKAKAKLQNKASQSGLNVPNDNNLRGHLAVTITSSFLKEPLGHQTFCFLREIYNLNEFSHATAISIIDKLYNDQKLNITHVCLRGHDTATRPSTRSGQALQTVSQAQEQCFQES